MPTEVTKTDQEFVTASLKDRHAFVGIVERYELPLRRYLRRLGCTDKGDIDDVLQEVFIKVFLNLNDYDPRLNFSSWIYRISHNETISFFRKKKIRPGVLTLSAEDTETFFAQLTDGQDHLKMAEDRDDLRLIESALEKVGGKYREVLVLRFLEEKSYTEIGDILRLPEGTVATLVSRGKKELRSILEAKGIKKL